MLPIFWQNQCCEDLFTGKIYLFLITFFFNPSNLFAKEEFPGIIQSLETISNINQNRLDKRMQSLAKTTSMERAVMTNEEVSIDPSYIQALIMNSNISFVNMAMKDECSFYAYFENDLLRTSEKSNLEKSGYVPVTISDNVKPVFQLMKKEQLLNSIYSKKCFPNKEMGKLFSPGFYKKTLSSLKFSIPKNTAECSSVFSDWKSNNYLPYLCKFAEINRTLRKNEFEYASTNDLDRKKILKLQIQAANELTKDIPLVQKNYLENLCYNLESEENFCNKYLGKDTWTRIVGGELAQTKLTGLCQNLLAKDNVSLQDLSNCAVQFNENPKMCNTIGSKKFPAIFPRPDCEETSDALAVSQLHYKNEDCPGLVDNESVTLVHRIINHYKPRDYVSNSKNCHTEVLSTFANLNFEFKFKQAWPLEICYKDRIENEDVCKTYVPGDDQNNRLSETVVMSKVMNRQYNSPEKMQCSIVDQDNYNPILLEFKNGCFIVVNKKQCTTFKCDKKIIYNGREINDIKYKGIPLFDTIPNSFNNESFAILNLLADYLKITRSTLKNLTELKFFLTQAPGRIVVGIGCAEDILPQHFLRHSLNQCTPLSFIVDGVKEINENTYLSLRTSIDDITAPRLINWNLIYNGVSSFREVHPLETWALYGFK